MKCITVTKENTSPLRSLRKQLKNISTITTKGFIKKWMPSAKYRMAST